MRITTRLALGLLLLTMPLAACGGGGDDGDGVASAGGGSSAATTSAAPQDATQAMLQYAQCMRDNGVPNFPDPEIQDGGSISLSMPDGVDLEKAKAANEKCRKYMPNGGEADQASPERIEQARQYAQCMRDKGVKNFPDPDSSGGFQLKDLDPNSSTMKTAEEACKPLLSAPAGGETRTESR